MDSTDMSEQPHPSEAELARLADGSLPAERAAELRARVRRSPELTAALAEQERAVALMRSVDERAPESLHARVAQLAMQPGATGTRPGRDRLRRALVLPGLTAVAVIAAAVIILIGGNQVGAPTVTQTAGLALSSATRPAPAVDPADPYRLKLTAGGITFPNWTDTSGFRPIGVRHDTIGGRSVTTVFYGRDGSRVGYAIVSGRAVHDIGGADTLTVRGVRFTLARQGTGYLITWVQSGHTCVLASHQMTPRALVRLVTEREEG